MRIKTDKVRPCPTQISKEELFDLYWNQDLNSREMGKLYGCDPATIRKRMADQGIKLKTWAEARHKTMVNLPKEELERLYCVEKWSMAKIAEYFHCSTGTVFRYMNKYEIPRRSYSTAWNATTSLSKELKEELERLYCVEKWSMEKIAEYFHCSTGTVFRYMKKYEIPRRSYNTARNATTPLSKELLDDLYWNQEMNITKIAKKLGYGVATIHEHMVGYGINFRTSSESRRGELNHFFGKTHTKEALEKMSGENAPNWQGGNSFEPYCQKFNRKFKEYIREKFGRVCFLCPTTEEENGRKLSVHHVDYNKDCLCGDFECEFVPLCDSCHGKTCHNREYWEKLIISKLSSVWRANPQKELTPSDWT